jgi:hypothetical protein
MNPITHILMNPSFSTKDKTFTIVYSLDDDESYRQTPIEKSIGYFWRQLVGSNFVFDDYNQVRNFPMYIYDKQLEKLRMFSLFTNMHKNLVNLSYEEMNPLGASYRVFDNYYNRLAGKYCIDLDLTGFNKLDQRSVIFPTFNRRSILRLKY